MRAGRGWPAAIALLCVLTACAGTPPAPVDSALSAGAAARVPLTSAAPPPTASTRVDATGRSTTSARTPAPRTADARRTVTRHLRPSSTPAPTTSTVASPNAKVHVIGDSITVDARPNLIARIPAATVDAEVGRQVQPGITALQAQRAAGTVADVTVFALGTNGSFTDSELTQAINLTAGHRLVVVTSHCPYCSWTDTNNATVHRLCTRATHCTVADFQAEAQRHPEWFGGDGVHMNVGGPGADAFARVVAAAVAAAAAAA